MTKKQQQLYAYLDAHPETTNSQRYKKAAEIYGVTDDGLSITAITHIYQWVEAQDWKAQMETEEPIVAKYKKKGNGNYVAYIVRTSAGMYYRCPKFIWETLNVEEHE